MSNSQKAAVLVALISAAATVLAAALVILPNFVSPQEDNGLSSQEVENPFLGKNLIMNPSAEEELRYWQAPANYKVRKENPLPHDGGYYFFPGANKSVVEATQSVDLLGLSSLIDSQQVKCRISAFMRNYQSKDESQFIVQFLSEAGQIIETLSSEVNTQSRIWKEYSEIYTPQVGTRTARIILRSTYKAGADNNDGYFDDLRLVCHRSG